MPEIPKRGSAPNKPPHKPEQKQPPPGKIRNPLTGRWINDPALKPKPEPKPPPPGKIKNPLTGRWINDPALKPPKPDPKPPPGKVKNPITGRWINDPALKKEKAEKKADPNNGPKTIYYDNVDSLTGKKIVKEKYTLKNGKMHGQYKSFFDNSMQKEAGQYVDGLKEGSWVLFSRQGGVMEYTSWIKGIRVDFSNKNGGGDSGDWWKKDTNNGNKWYKKGTSGSGGAGSGGAGSGGKSNSWDNWYNNNFGGGSDWDKFFGGGSGGGGSRAGGSSSRGAPPPTVSKTTECAQILQKHGLYPSKTIKALSPDEKKELQKNFRRWAMKNHPDKGGDTALFGVVSGCVDTLVKG